MKNHPTLSCIFTLPKLQSLKQKKSLLLIVQLQGKTAEDTEQVLGLVNCIFWKPWENNQFSIIVQHLSCTDFTVVFSVTCEA